jgi:hypothetical protein
MSKMIKTSLVALSLLAGASAGYAASNGGPDGRGPGMSDSRPENRIDAPDVWERNDIDPGSTGSIDRCDSGAYDEFGNCVADQNMMR